MKLLILRPQPGAAATAERARRLGLEPIVAPLFTVHAVSWNPPAGSFDAVILTSANAARYSGDGMTPYLHLSCYAVGEATAAAACLAGFTEIRTGPADGAELVAMMAADGIIRALHPCGADVTALHGDAVAITDVVVYRAEPVTILPRDVVAAVGKGALALLHSPRAGALFAALIGARREGIAIAAISPAAATAAGPGWSAVHIADRPRDEALLELAAKLCQTGGR